jgi:hypothetical protein
MTRIEIAELSADGSGSFRVRVSFGGHASHEVGLTDPADQDGEETWPDTSNSMSATRFSTATGNGRRSGSSRPTARP